MYLSSSSIAVGPVLRISTAERQRFGQSAEVDHHHSGLGRHWPRLQIDLGLQRGGQGPLGADQDAAQVEGPVADAFVQAVSTHPAQDLGVAPPDLVLLGGNQPLEDSDDLALPRGRRQHPRQLRLGESTRGNPLPVGQDHGHFQDVLDGSAVDDRSGARRVVAYHAADSGPIARGDVGGEPEAVRPKLGVQLVQDDAGLDASPSLFGIHLEDSVEILGHVQDDCSADGLTAEGRPGAAGQDRHGRPPADIHHGQDVLFRLRDYQAEGLDLVDAGVGAVERLGHRVEANLTRHALPKVADQIVHTELRFNGKRTTDNEKPGNERGVGRWVSASAFRCPVVGFTLSVLPCRFSWAISRPSSPAGRGHWCSR